MENGWNPEKMMYLQLTNDSFRLRDHNMQILDLRQFPSDVDLLRKIYDDDWPITLIDNQFNLNQDVFENTAAAVNMNSFSNVNEYLYRTWL